MKITKLLSLLIASGLLFSCKRDTEIKYNFPPKPVRKSVQNDSRLSDILSAYAPQSNNFRIDAAAGGTVITSKGSTYTFPPSTFVYANGTSVTGNVDLKIKEISTASEMIFADKPTVTNDGSILESFGEFNVTASQGAVPVFIDPKAGQINVNVPLRRDSTSQRFEIPMWDGDTIVEYVMQGRDFENNPVTIQFQQPLRKGIDWVRNNNFAMSSGSQINFPIEKLGTWVNCDILIPAAGATTLICYFSNVFNDSSSASNMLFFKVKNTNSVIKIYENILNAPAGKSGFIGYQNRFNIGLQGTLIGMVHKGGKFYVATKDITVGMPEPGKTFFGTDLVLREVTETEMIAEINSVNLK